MSGTSSDAFLLKKRKLDEIQDSRYDKTSVGSEVVVISDSSNEEDDDDDTESLEDFSSEYISEYERIRLQNIEERNRLLRSLGILQAPINNNSVEPVKKKPRVKKSFEELPRRESLRLKRRSSAEEAPVKENLGIWSKGRNSLVKRDEDIKTRTGRPLVVPQRYLD